jgi:hypothetical protein
MTAFFIVTAMKTSNLTKKSLLWYLLHSCFPVACLWTSPVCPRWLLIWGTAAGSILHIACKVCNTASPRGVTVGWQRSYEFRMTKREHFPNHRNRLVFCNEEPVFWISGMTSHAVWREPKVSEEHIASIFRVEG